MKSFIRSIVEKFDIDNQLTRAGVITYDSDARLDIKLSDYNAMRPLLDEITALPYAEGKATRIDKALIMASDEAFTEKNGARPGVRKVFEYKLLYHLW